MAKQEFTEVLSKKELINGFAELTGKKKNESEQVLDTVFSYLEDILYAQNKGFKLGDIGTVKLQIVPEREHPVPNFDKEAAKDPNYKPKTVVKPEHYGLKFKPNDAFKRDLAEVPVEG